MIFLIDYDRREGRLVTLREFDDSEERVAQDERLALELTLHRQGIQREVVLLDASSLDALKKTHGRYFYTLTELVEQFAKSVHPE